MQPFSPEKQAKKTKLIERHSINNEVVQEQIFPSRKKKHQREDALSEETNKQIPTKSLILAQDER